MPRGEPRCRCPWVRANNLSWLRRFAVTLLKRHPEKDRIRGQMIRCLMDTSFLDGVLTFQGNSYALVLTLGGVLGALRRHRSSAGKLTDAASHLVNLSRSYWRGWFACYDTAGVPRTNNDLEPLFGSHRYHERRASGRKGGSPGTVLRGSVRLAAALATRTGEVTSSDLAVSDRDQWKRVRAELEVRRQRRVERRRFRQNPKEYLEALENKLIQSGLPV